ncbi:hypothetical protein [Halobaculum litoreum]|uniref:STAS domain-containing protein n=1 Tax=Halobaculum litoreum TaxID=3031998 RepID=A0ABD5XPC4_9EURY|nr:hypothetical protein [Halobaculum sp. DT92]
MSSTIEPEPTPSVDRSRDGTVLRVELVGEFGAADVVRTMARARHVAEGCDARFDVIVDVREFAAHGGALGALGEWETFLRMAGACTVVRVGEGRAVGGRPPRGHHGRRRGPARTVTPTIDDPGEGRRHAVAEPWRPCDTAAGARVSPLPSRPAPPLGRRISKE